MDIEKLIEQLNARGLSNGSSLGYHCGLYDEAATALSTLQDENERLKNKLSELAHLPFDEPGIGERTRLMAENAQLRAELEYEREHANAYHQECGQWEAENENLRGELEQVKQDMNSIEQDFRAFTKQWWEQDSGFPCRWCKFENSGGCEWKVKHPGEICAGRAFEWRGQKEE